MFTNRKILGSMLVLVVGTMLLSACAPSDATPTPAPEVIYTQVAMTVQAGLTQTAEAMPTATQTETPVPTQTLEPTLVASPTVDSTPTQTIQPTIARPANPDRADWVTQVPADGTTMFPDQAFNLVWTVKNTGTTTWNTRYQVRYFLTDTTMRFGSPDIKFPKDVKPNESVDLTLSMKAPNRAGEFNTVWVLTNADGANFYTLYLKIRVGGSTPTPSPTATANPTSTAETPIVTANP